MNRGEFLESVIKDKGHTTASLSKESGVAYTTIRSMIERNLKNASIDNVLKICKVLGIKAEELQNGKYASKEDKNNLPDLNDKDEKDIQKDLEGIINNLENNSGYAAFDGQDIDEMDKDDRELLISSLENSLRLAKRLAKQKFTPNKYKE